MGADGRVVAEAGFLGVVAVGVAVVRRAEYRIDDELGEIAGIERRGAGQCDLGGIGIGPAVTAVDDREIGFELQLRAMLVGERQCYRIRAEGRRIGLRERFRAVCLQECLVGADVLR